MGKPQAGASTSPRRIGERGRPFSLRDAIAWVGPSPGSHSEPQIDRTIRGELACGTPTACRHTCIRQALRGLTMMQSCASTAKFRAAGPFSRTAFEAMPASGHRHLGSFSTSGRSRPRAPNSWNSLDARGRLQRRVQDDAFRHFAGGHEAPQRDQQLAGQSHDQRLAGGAAGFGRARPIPLGQRTVLLEH